MEMEKTSIFSKWKTTSNISEDKLILEDDIKFWKMEDDIIILAKGKQNTIF